MTEETDRDGAATGAGGRAAGLRVLVVGASSGIGHEVARQLIGAGASVAAGARRAERLGALEGAHPVPADVSDPDQCADMVGRAAAALGGLDVLVYIAGITRVTPLDTADQAAWQELFATNLFGAAACTRAALPHLQAPGSGGRALFATSDSADLAYPGMVAYAASKAALGRFCQGLAAEYPALQVSELLVGPTMGTEVSDGFGPGELEHWGQLWYEGGYIRYGLMEAADAAALIVDAVVHPSPAARVEVLIPIDQAPPDEAFL